MNLNLFLPISFFLIVARKGISFSAAANSNAARSSLQRTACRADVTTPGTLQRRAQYVFHRGRPDATRSKRSR
jgi:hypothetical protein